MYILTPSNKLSVFLIRTNVNNLLQNVVLCECRNKNTVKILLKLLNIEQVFFYNSLP